MHLYPDTYREEYNPKLYKMMYERSQWVVSFSKYPINDQQLYAHAGYEYIKGKSPIHIAPEQPPLGKYLIGLSIVIFGNQNIMNLIFSVLTLIMIWLITNKLTKSAVASALAVFLTAINTLFLTQLPESPLFDIFQIFFFLVFILLMITYENNNKKTYLILAGVAAGAFISVKVFHIFYAIFFIWTGTYFFTANKKWSKTVWNFLILQGAALLTFTLSYAKYFFDGGNLRSFLGVQKWIYTFYSDSAIDKTKLFGNYLELIFLNRWRIWSEGYPYIKYEHWSVLWPAIFLLSLLALWRLSKTLKPDIKKPVILLGTFLIIYNLFLFFVPVFPRYLLIMFVVMNIILSIYVASIKKNKAL